MHGFVHAALVRLTVPTRIRLLRQIQHRTGWGKPEIVSYQDRQVERLIKYCWEFVPYYRTKWKGHISGPSDVTKVEHLQRLPTLTKDELRDHLAELTTTRKADRGEDAHSGGSTGRPTHFRMTKFDQEMCWAQIYTGWCWAGYNVGDPFLAVGGESIGIGLTDRRTWRDWVINRWTTSGSNLTAARARALGEAPHFNSIRLIYGYPNSIRELGEHLHEMRRIPRSLRGIVCTAEVMRDEIRKRIEQIFRVPVFDQYGLNDGGLLAVEGPEHDGLHVFFHRAVLEILDDNNSLITEIGQPGRAVATSLTNYATPFVRYETGDEVHWRSYSSAPSGVRWPRIGPVDGRTGDVIYLPSGRSIPMPGLTLVMRWLEGLHQYQFIQTGADQVTVRLDRGHGFRMTEADVIAYLRSKISDEIQWKIQWAEPQRTGNNKVLIIRNEWLRSQGLTRPAGT